LHSVSVGSIIRALGTTSGKEASGGAAGAGDRSAGLGISSAGILAGTRPRGWPHKRTLAFVRAPAL
jgi:hypothetical protein